MRVETRDPSQRKPLILFLNPLIYRPQKDNVAKAFVLISRWYHGHIFALSGGRQRNISLGDFVFHAEGSGNGVASRLLRGLWVQIVVPLLLLLGRSRVSAVVAYDPYRSGLAALALRYAFRCKMIVELNGDYHRTEPGQSVVSRTIMKTLFGFVLRRADAIKVLNADQEEFCRKLVGARPVYRFPAFTATEYFQSLNSYQGDYLLSIGHPFDLKGMDVLINAFRRVGGKHGWAKLRIMGHCPRTELVTYEKLAGDDPRIQFVEPGWIENVGEQVRGCYALVNAARTESMGRIHIEAMACGKPIIATRTNGGLECVEDGKTGLLCAINDVEDLAAKLDDLLSDADRADKMGRAGILRMQEKFSEPVYAEAFHKMVEEVTGRMPGQAER